MNSLLVTGGVGVIGANFIRLLLEGDEVERIVNLDLMTYAGNPENLADLEDDPRYFFVRGDIGEGELSRRLMVEHHIDAVVNFAAESHVDRSIDSPEPFFQTNVMGTLSLLDAARKHWSSLSDPDRSSFRFLHVSTDEVYGSLTLEDSPFCESTSYAPNSPYSASKAGVIALTKSAGKECAKMDISINCITPAAAKTRIFDQMSQEHIDYMLSKIPRERFLQVEEVADMVNWLCSRGNSFTTGAVFDISGGRATY